MEIWQEKAMRLQNEVDALKKRISYLTVNAIYPADMGDEHIVERTACAIGREVERSLITSLNHPVPLWKYSIHKDIEDSPYLHNIGSIAIMPDMVLSERIKTVHAECALIVPSVFF